MDDDDLYNLPFKKEKIQEVQSRIREITLEQEDKVKELNGRLYTTKSRGVSIKIYGNYRVEEVSIDQNFFETASKSMLEKAIKDAYQSVYDLIRDEISTIQNDSREKMESLYKEIQLDDGTNRSN